MDKKILAIGGAVIKTAHKELLSVIRCGDIEMLIYNGGSLFHDYQLGRLERSGTKAKLPSGGAAQSKEAVMLMGRTSFPLDDLLDDYTILEKTSRRVWLGIRNGIAEKGTEFSAAKICHRNNIPTLMFTAPYTDFWYLFQTGEALSHLFAEFQDDCWEKLVERFRKDNFHFVCMGSAVIIPEIFIKAIAVAKPKNFRADVVDFKDMYRPRTRIAERYGTYYIAEHKVFLSEWHKNGYPNIKSD